MRGSKQPDARNKSPPPDTMLSFAPQPIFTGNWDHNHRPSVSSPLSSSPLRASSPNSNRDDNMFSQRQTQSSPIQQPKFKFASRQTRPNPVMRRREEAQEQRRKNFLRNVREKAEEKAFQRRDIEGHFVKTSWLADIGRLSYDAPEVSEADIEDAATFQQPARSDEGDDMMTDDGEEAELEAMIAAYQNQKEELATTQASSPNASGDEYDEIFAELMSQEQASQEQPAVESADQMDLNQ